MEPIIEIEEVEQGNGVVYNRFKKSKGKSSLPGKLVHRILNETVASFTPFFILLLGNSTRFHFYPEHDIALLNQVIADRPFLAGYGQTDDKWNDVAKALKPAGITATPRSLRERFKSLVELFRSEDYGNLRKSGSEELYGERERLLTEIIELIDSEKKEREEKKAKTARDNLVAQQMREAAMVTLKEKAANDREPDEVSEHPVGSKRSKIDEQLASSLAERDVRKQEGQQLEKMRIELETKKIELERESLKIKEQQIQLELKKQEQQAVESNQKQLNERERLALEIKDREDQRQATRQLYQAMAESAKAQYAMFHELITLIKKS